MKFNFQIEYDVLKTLCQRYIKYFISLPLLHSKLIKPGFKNTKKNVVKLLTNNQWKKNPHAKILLRKFTFFFRYFKRTWLKRWTPDDISVYGQEVRTNNVIENYHGQLNKLIAVKNPTPKKFLGKHCIVIHTLNEIFAYF